MSNVTGQVAGDELATADYWVRHVRAAVRFADGVATLQAQGVDSFLEVGPKPVLLGLAGETLGREGAAAQGTQGTDGREDAKAQSTLVLLPSLRGGQGDWRSMLTSMGTLYERGVNIDWAGFDRDYSRCRVALPTYPFQRQRYWVEPAPQTLTPPLHDWWAQTDLSALATRLSARTAYGDPSHLLPLLQALRSEQQTMLLAPSFDEQCYDLTWVAVPATPVPTIPPPTEGAPSHWLILADQAGLGSAVAERLRATGYATTIIHAAAFDHPIPLPEHPLAGILVLNAPDANQVPTALLANDLAVSSLLQEQERLCGTLLHLVQHLLAQRTALTTRPRIWVATRGAQAVPNLAQTRSLALLQAPLWGLGRVVALEAPEFWGGLIDLEPATATATWDDDLAALCSCLFAPDHEEQVAFRAGQRYAARLVAHPATPPTTPVVVAPTACYLITGGTGTLGLANAHWLAAQGARHLILTSRRGVTTAAQQTAIDALGTQGVQIQLLTIDVADPQAMAELQTLLAAQATPLRGVIHAAGTSSIEPLATLSWAAMAEVVRPKLLGGLLLHEVVQSQPLDFFINYSSGAGIWGGKGQAHYAAANHALDGLAAWRHVQGLPALSIAWGPIADSGMLTAEEQGQLTSIGVHTLSIAQMVATQERLLAQRVAQAVVAVMEWERFREVYTSNRPRTLLALPSVLI